MHLYLILNLAASHKITFAFESRNLLVPIFYSAPHYADVLMTRSLSFLIIFLIRLFFTLLSSGIRFVVPEISSCFDLITYSKLQEGLDRYL